MCSAWLCTWSAKTAHARPFLIAYLPVIIIDAVQWHDIEGIWNHSIDKKNSVKNKVKAFQGLLHRIGKPHENNPTQNKKYLIQ